MVTSRDYFAYRRGRVDYLTHLSPRHDGGFDPAASVHDRSISPLVAPVSRGDDLAAVFGDPSPYFRFSFVRNPFTRALSCYLEKIAGEQWLREKRLPDLGFEPDEEVSFVEFLRRVAEQPRRQMDIHWAPAHFLLGLGTVRYDFLGRFENFQADLQRVIDVLGLEVPADLPRQRTAHVTGAGERLREHYDGEAIELVRHIYRGDFEALGYGSDLRVAT